MTWDRWLVVAAALGAGYAAGGAWLPRGDVVLGPDFPEDGVHTVFLWAAVARGLGPEAPLLHLDSFWFPAGRPLLDAAWNVLDALLAAPLLWALGPIRGVVAATALFGVLNALAGGWMGGRVGGPGWPRVVGAVGVGFAPFALAEIQQGRPTQALLAPVALAVGLAWEREGRGVAAGLATALAGLVYWFYGLFAAVAVGGVMLARGRGVRALAWAAVGAIVPILPFFGAVAARWGDLQGTGARPSFEVPVALPWQVVTPWTPGPDSYVPVALVALAGAALLTRERRGAFGLLAAAAALWVLALGRDVTIGGTRFVLPWAWLRDLPVLERLWWPYRALGPATVVLAAGASVAVAGRLRLLAPLACAAVVAQALALPGLPDAFRAPPAQAWTAALPPGPVLLLPALEVRGSRLHLLEQVRHARPLVNGMGMPHRFLWPPAFAAWWGADPLLVGIEAVEAGRAPVGAADPAGLRAAGVVGVVAEAAWLGRLPTDARRWLESALGTPECTADPRWCVWALDADGGPAGDVPG
ncbi:MAG: hypothetical protein ACK4YP_12250 [Myxococcota bacterium]